MAPYMATILGVVPTARHQTYLLPSWPGIFSRKKIVLPEPRLSTDDSPVSSDEDERKQSSNRYSVASAVSTSSAATTATTATASTVASTSSSRTAASLATSPSSLDSTSSTESFLTCPMGAATAATGAGTASPSYADALTDEPQQYVRTTFAKKQKKAKKPPRPVRRRLTRTMPDTFRCRRCGTDLAFRAQIVSKGFTGRHGRAYLVSAPATSPDHLLAPERLAAEAKDVENNLPNIVVGSYENRHLVTGFHIVADISCQHCHVKLGWKYIDADDDVQRYKIGKFILEKARVASFRSWDDVDEEEDAESSDDEEEREDDDGYDSDIFGYGENSNKESNNTTTTTTTTTSKGKNTQPLVPGDDDYDDIFPFSHATPSSALVDSVGVVRALTTGNTTLHPESDFGDLDEIVFDSDDSEECEDIFEGIWDAKVVAERRKLRKTSKV